MNATEAIRSLNLTGGEVLTLEKAKDRIEFEALPVMGISADKCLFSKTNCDEYCETKCDGYCSQKSCDYTKPCPSDDPDPCSYSPGCPSKHVG